MKLFRSKLGKVFSLLSMWSIIVQLVIPAASYALTGGPSQPEVGGFQPMGTSDLVDPFTGDFKYNLPLFTLPGPDGGYPFNLSYQSGVGMDQESSWVGLGWSLNPGAINRQKRGIPDDFDGDNIKIERRKKSQHHYGFETSIPVGEVELFGATIDLSKKLKPSVSLYHNTERGLGYSVSVSPRTHLGNGKISTQLSLGLSMDSQEGYSAQP